MTSDQPPGPEAPTDVDGSAEAIPPEPTPLEPTPLEPTPAGATAAGATLREPTLVEPMDGPDRVVLAQPKFLAGVTAVFALIALLAAPTIPAAALVAVVPLLMAVWVLRSRVVLDAAGVHVRTLLSSTDVPWHEVAGFQVRRAGRLKSPVQLQRTSGEPVTLPTVSREDLAVLVGQSARLGAGG